MPNTDGIETGSDIIRTLLKDATPRPWRVAKSHADGTHIRLPLDEIQHQGETWERDEAFFCDDGSAVAVCPDLREAWGDGETNAALIVTAVNAYEHHLEVIQELVSACEATVQMFNECEDFDNFADDLVSDGVITMLREAINHAKEQ